MSKAVTVVDSRPLAAVMPTPEEWAMVKEQAKLLVSSGMLPRTVDTPEKAIVIMLKGRELGFATMQSFAHINVIEGKPVLDAQGMLAQVYKNCPGAEIDFFVTTDHICRIMAARPGREKREFSYSIDDAQRAGLLSKDNWKKHPKSMLRHRAASAMCRTLFADCIDNAYIPDEVEEIVETAKEEASQDGKADELTKLLKAKSAEVIEPEVQPDFDGMERRD